MNKFNKSTREIQVRAHIIAFRKLSRERQDERRAIIIDYINSLADDQLKELLKKALEDGEQNPDLCDTIIFGFMMALDELIFNEVVKLLIKLDQLPVKNEGFKPQPKYQLPGDR